MPVDNLASLFTTRLAAAGIEYMVAGVELLLAPPEYVIVRKLAYFREGGSEKHLRDIASILTTSRGDVDLAQIATLTERMGLQAQWLQAQAEAAKLAD